MFVSVPFNAGVFKISPDCDPSLGRHLLLVMAFEYDTCLGWDRCSSVEIVNVL